MEVADGLAAALADYPVLDEMHWSDLEWTEASDYWASLSVRDRAEICQQSGASIFSARRDYLPEDDTGAIMECLRP